MRSAQSYSESPRVQLISISIIVQDIMEQLESVGWVKATQKESNEITELDVNEIFTMIDVDKSGSVSRTVNFPIRR